MLAVGSRAFVNCARDSGGSVVLTDESGRTARSRLCDGIEVEVLAWLPRGRAGTRYRVRVGHDGADGWLEAESLRTSLAPLPPPALEEPNEPQGDDGGRRFGQRAWPQR